MLKNRFRNNHDARLRILPSRPLQVALEFAEMVVRKNPDRRPAQSRTIDQRSMAKFVENHDILFRGERRQRSDGGRITAAEANRRGASLPFRQRGFENNVRRLRPADQARGAGTDAELFDRRDRRLPQQADRPPNPR